jgi:hypothetical protein
VGLLSFTNTSHQRRASPKRRYVFPPGANRCRKNYALRDSPLLARQDICWICLYIASPISLAGFRATVHVSKAAQRSRHLGISARCAYGGTVPTGDEIQDIDTLRVLVATPEALSGTLSAEPDFFQRISLVICDEGHLLDSGDRGVGLELLLARMRARPNGSPRLVFVSAIVPNIVEINAWLGGPADSVVRSDYRPATAEFAAIRPHPANSPTQIDLVMHPHLVRVVRAIQTTYLIVSCHFSLADV